jgi:hypothetical protein
MSVRHLALRRFAVEKEIGGHTLDASACPRAVRRPSVMRRSFPVRKRGRKAW